MEIAAANVVEPGEAALVVTTGYFSDRMTQIFDRQGVKVVRVAAPIGSVPDLTEIARALATQSIKAVAVTHVDTSTGVRAPVEAIAKLAREHGALSLSDGVCALGAETMRQDAWGVDVAFTGSQKALGVPPGLAIVLAGPRAMAAYRARKTRVASLYSDFGQWLPIMEAYEAKKPAYFATPAVNLVTALDVSLGHLLAEGMDARFVRHARIADAFRAAFRVLGLAPLPTSADVTANTLSALYYPEGVDASLVGHVRDEGVVIAGGLHPEVRAKYFRVGHMGAVSASDVLATVGALERGLARAGHGKAGGAALAAAQVSLATLTQR
jgi:alanine-glyoxylate transaminase / serine-glyoxylate transaminase / serine-pyruvate transaminase